MGSVAFHHNHEKFALLMKPYVCLLYTSADIDISALREFQMLDYSLQKDMGAFKPTPPDFNLKVLEMKRNRTLFEWIMETYD